MTDTSKAYEENCKTREPRPMEKARNDLMYTLRSWLGKWFVPLQQSLMVLDTQQMKVAQS